MSHQLYVFGSNGEGQLGIPAADIVNIPTKVPNVSFLEHLKAIRGGDNHSLFQLEDGAVYKVGDNRKGQLGSSNQQSRPSDLTKAPLRASFVAATCESSAYIVPQANCPETAVFIEGSGQWGEVADTSVAGSDTTPNTTLPGTVIDFAAGVWHYVAILEDGSVYGWGKARLGQLGENVSGKVTTPTKLEDIPFKPAKVICGKDFTYLAGDPTTGEHAILGKDKFNIISNMPADIKDWKDIGATWHAIFVLFNNGTLTAWGKENMWKLLPPDLPPLEKIAVGSDHMLALTKDGKLISWGWGKHGNCGDFSNVGREIKNDMVNGFWNNIDIPGEIQMIGAGFCTSFVVSR